MPHQLSKWERRKQSPGEQEDSSWEKSVGWVPVPVSCRLGLTAVPVGRRDTEDSFHLLRERSWLT